jgi:hypothetical protein
VRRLPRNAGRSRGRLQCPGQFAHGRRSALAHGRSEHREAGHQRGRLGHIEDDGDRGACGRQAHPASAALTDIERDAAEPEPFDVAGDRPRRHTEVTRQVPEPQPLPVGAVQSFDEDLLALDPSQGEMPVAGGRGEPDSSLHHLIPNVDTGLTGLVSILRTMTDTNDKAHEFFDRYAAALLARDEKAIAGMYAVPSLILFPGNAIPVSDAGQTEQFFASSWSQYEGVDKADGQIVIMGEAPGSVWADVTWFFDGEAAQERFCYQLVERPDGYQIAVLTPMELASR